MSPTTPAKPSVITKTRRTEPPRHAGPPPGRAPRGNAECCAGDDQQGEGDQVLRREDAHRAWILGECAQAAFLRLRVDAALRDEAALDAGAGRARRFFGAGV